MSIMPQQNQGWFCCGPCRSAFAERDLEVRYGSPFRIGTELQKRRGRKSAVFREVPLGER